MNEITNPFSRTHAASTNAQALQRNFLLPAAQLMIILGTLLSFGFALEISAENTPSQKKHPSPPVVLFGMEKYFPGMTQMPDGSLKAFFQNAEGKLASVSFSGDGLSLSEPKVFMAGQMPEKGLPDVTTTLATTNGDLHVIQLLVRYKAHRPGGPTGPAITEFYDLWYDRARGNGTKWDGPKTIWEGWCGALPDWRQLSSGRIIVSLGSWVAGRNNTHPTGGHFVTVVYSDDNGETWSQSLAEIIAPVYRGYNGNNNGACEPTIMELKDGRLWILMRTQTGFMYESYSSDNGATWCEASPSRFYSSTSPSDLVRLPDGRLVFIWNNYENPPLVDGQEEYGGRDALHAAISVDDGKSWRGFREIYRDPYRLYPERATEDRGTGYPYAYHTQTGTIVVVSGQAKGRRNVIVVDPDWLTQPHHEDDFSNGLDGWLTFKPVGPPLAAGPQRKRVFGPQLVDHPSKAGAKVLHIRRPDNNDGDGASWNFPSGWRGRLTLRLMFRSGSGRSTIALGDRAFNPTDDNGEKYAQFNLPIGATGQLGEGPMLESGRWYTVELVWDLSKPICNVLLDGEETLQLKLNNETSNGISYLRLRSLATRPDPIGFLVESVRVNIDDLVTPPRTDEEIRIAYNKYRSTVSYDSSSKAKSDLK